MLIDHLDKSNAHWLKERFIHSYMAFFLLPDNNVSFDSTWHFSWFLLIHNFSKKSVAILATLCYYIPVYNLVDYQYYRIPRR